MQSEWGERERGGHGNFCMELFCVLYILTQTYVIRREWTKYKKAFSQFITTVTTVNMVGWLVGWFVFGFLLNSTLCPFHSCLLLLSLLYYHFICFFLSIFRLILISFTENIFIWMYSPYSIVVILQKQIYLYHSTN